MKGLQSRGMKPNNFNQYLLWLKQPLISSLKYRHTSWVFKYIYSDLTRKKNKLLAATDATKYKWTSEFI